MMKEKIILFFLAWTLGVWGGGFLLLLIFLGSIKIRGYRRKKFTSKKGLIIISNHPSLVEPCLLPFLLFPWYLVFPRFVPISTPDRGNYYRKFWFFFLRPVCIPVERSASKEALRVLKRLRKAVEEGKVLILFPEAGRTFKGEKHLVLNGRKIRKFPPGIVRLFHNLDCSILPVWVEGTEKILPNKFNFSDHLPFFRFWRKAEISIGEVIDSQKLPKKREIISFLENVLLRV